VISESSSSYDNYGSKTIRIIQNCIIQGNAVEAGSSSYANALGGGV